jgi:hypothetical protein
VSRVFVVPRIMVDHSHKDPSVCAVMGDGTDGRNHAEKGRGMGGGGKAHLTLSDSLTVPAIASEKRLPSVFPAPVFCQAR